MSSEKQRSAGAVIIAGRYAVVSCLHQGSQSSVFLCEDLRRNKCRVAIKLLSHDVPPNSPDGLRFRHEMGLSMTVRHQHVVNAYESFDKGTLVGFAMEFADGGDLAGFLAEFGRLEVGDALHILRQIGLGLVAIHDHGIIHRDLKPENILLDAAGRAKIADFGIACLCSRIGVVTRDKVVGTVDYISPEFLARGELSLASDIYALGVLGYELITGACPFQGASLIESLRHQLTQDPVPPSRLVPAAPPSVDALLLGAMSRDPRRRIPSALEFVRGTEAVLRDYWGQRESKLAGGGGEV